MEHNAGFLRKMSASHLSVVSNVITLTLPVYTRQGREGGYVSLFKKQEMEQFLGYGAGLHTEVRMDEFCSSVVSAAVD